ncbi:hypothetical protein MSAN_00774800 [Mycena sanguinolenta]|uniref:Uncharacterized protein n=1 Tax=Mycena sanguinolenta TaxID=230812 RepID=A0A8H7DGH9_9AGAR|nr:hypothetical protein MSAN_00774800 [Mycena sanguinolenta]
MLALATGHTLDIDAANPQRWIARIWATAEFSLGATCHRPTAPPPVLLSRTELKRAFLGIKLRRLPPPTYTSHHRIRDPHACANPGAHVRRDGDAQYPPASAAELVDPIPPRAAGYVGPCLGLARPHRAGTTSPDITRRIPLSSYSPWSGGAGRGESGQNEYEQGEDEVGGGMKTKGIPRTGTSRHACGYPCARSHSHLASFPVLPVSLRSLGSEPIRICRAASTLQPPHTHPAAGCGCRFARGRAPHRLVLPNPPFRMCVAESRVHIIELTLRTYLEFSDVKHG